MIRKFVLLTLLLIVVFSPVYAQVFGDIAYDAEDVVVGVDDERGFTAQVEVTSNLFQMTDVKFSDAPERDRRTDHTLINNFPFGGTNILDGTLVRFGYNADRFGGALSVKSSGIEGIRAWISFLNGKLRVSAGNDIGYSFANTQGAPAGLRVYDDNVRNVGEGQAEDPTVDSNKTPDDITGGQGVLMEVFLDTAVPLTIALAAGGNLADTGRVLMTPIPGTPNRQEAVFGHSLRYGANIGGKIGDIAGLNVAYIIDSEKAQSQFRWNTPTSELVARRADAHIVTHQMGAFGSLYPFKNDSLGITLGYAGVIVRYLEEFEMTVTGPRVTVMPQVIKHGINLAARYQTENLTLRTDHNYSFWSDRNYRVFNLHRPNVDMADWGLSSTAEVANEFGDVSHSFLWNGAGVSYRITDILTGSVSARNLLRMDETAQFRMLNNYSAVELRATFNFGSSVETFVGFVFDYTMRGTNRALSQGVDEFPAAFNPRDTSDTRMMVQVPIGFTVRLQKDVFARGE